MSQQLRVNPARVKEGALSMARFFPITHFSNRHRRRLQLLQEIELFNPESGSSTSTMFLGHMKYIHVRKDVLNDKGLVDPWEL
jgi:hypothetical protein